MNDKKGMAAMLVASMGKKPAEGPEEGGEYEGKQACAEEMMNAIESNDSAAFMKALDAYLDHR
jgi:L-arabinose isomerase